jgi:hypothetical protein
MKCCIARLDITLVERWLCIAVVTVSLVVGGRKRASLRWWLPVGDTKIES